MAVPLLSNLKNLNHSIELKGKQLRLKKVFESGQLWDGYILRTPRLHFALTHNYKKLKEKGCSWLNSPKLLLTNYTVIPSRRFLTNI